MVLEDQVALSLPPCGLCFQEEKGSRARMEPVVFRILLTLKNSAGGLLAVGLLLTPWVWERQVSVHLKLTVMALWLVFFKGRLPHRPSLKDGS